MDKSKSVHAFTFGDPVPVLEGADILNYFESVLLHDKYYMPPIDFNGLSRAYRSAAHHQSAITVKKNILLSTCKTTALLPRTTLEKLVNDYLIFGNAYLEKITNSWGKTIALDVPLAKYVRKGIEQGMFYFLHNFNEHEFAKDSIFHLINPDINQEIYGLPDYFSSLQSAFLNESATLFRRKYYQNGAHAGAILYLTDPMQNEDDILAIKEQLSQAKGKGNFKNLFIHAPNGKKDGIQVIPLSDIVAKDEFLNIKNSSRDDILAAHRVPPQLMGIIPTNAAGFGDVEKAGKVFFINEIKPLQQRLEEVNHWLGETVITFTPYELLNDKN
ncbi:phage portal protein [Canicola haemoglobinophilus]|uniref:Portal vertex protein n=1 Tax=Canicola haemoglobinophilus TaxID=733 RepID=A0A1V4B177_9PAST|nr:phage portal protein [Canicola haemoglobinophilus]OOS00662.1 phage portal protein [Canicola haemoglobinophilus]STO60184.1 portal vertex protein [Canicola haemoglobinophilus]